MFSYSLLQQFSGATTKKATIGELVSGGSSDCVEELRSGVRVGGEAPARESPDCGDDCEGLDECGSSRVSGDCCDLVVSPIRSTGGDDCGGSDPVCSDIDFNVNASSKNAN